LQVFQSPCASEGEGEIIFSLGKNNPREGGRGKGRAGRTVLTTLWFLKGEKSGKTTEKRPWPIPSGKRYNPCDVVANKGKFLHQKRETFCKSEMKSQLGLKIAGRTGWGAGPIYWRWGGHKAKKSVRKGGLSELRPEIMARLQKGDYSLTVYLKNRPLGALGHPKEVGC